MLIIVYFLIFLFISIFYKLFLFFSIQIVTYLIYLGLIKNTMILNLNKLNVQKPSQNNLINSQSFQLKNKITINSVTQTHYTVEGVQIYSSQQIKALKESQQKVKNYQNKQPVQLKLYQIADYFQEFQESKQLNPKQKVNQLLKTKYDKDIAKSSFIDKQFTDKSQNKNSKNLNVKQKLAKNNINLTKLQKQKNKKDALQKKLTQLSKHYKQYFGNIKNSQNPSNFQQNPLHLQQNISLSQNIQKINKINQNHSSEQDQNYQQQKIKSKVGLINKKKQNSHLISKNNKSVSNTSTHQTKQTNKMKSNKKKQLLQDQKLQNSQTIQFQDVQEGLDLIGEVICNRSTYSQKLGSAVHLLFN